MPAKLRVITPEFVLEVGDKTLRVIGFVGRNIQSASGLIVKQGQSNNFWNIPIEDVEEVLEQTQSTASGNKDVNWYRVRYVYVGEDPDLIVGRKREPKTE